MNMADLQCPWIVPGKVDPVGPQIVLGQVGHKVVAPGGFARRVASLDWVVLWVVWEDPGSL